MPAHVQGQPDCTAICSPVPARTQFGPSASQLFGLIKPSNLQQMLLNRFVLSCMERNIYRTRRRWKDNIKMNIKEIVLQIGTAFIWDMTKSRIVLFSIGQFNFRVSNSWITSMWFTLCFTIVAQNFLSYGPFSELRQSGIFHFRNFAHPIFLKIIRS